MSKSEGYNLFRWAVVEHVLDELRSDRLEGGAADPLRSFARRYHVRWELGPRTFLLEERESWVGIELHLLGSHEVRPADNEGACDSCKELWQGLVAIAERASPKEQHGCKHQVAQCVIRMDTPEQERLHMIRLSITFVHRNSVWAAEDAACSDQCVAEFQRCLRAMGISERAKGTEG